MESPSSGVRLHSVNTVEFERVRIVGPTGNSSRPGSTKKQRFRDRVPARGKGARAAPKNSDSERHVRLVDEAGEIIAGHGRMLAARHLGLATVPVMVARGGQPARSALPREQT
jgi:hypothetical protein